MPTIQLDPSLTMYFEDHYFGPPWQRPEAVLLVHGVGESSLAWFAWVPRLAAEFRVIRPDHRGFGRSTVPPPDYSWSVGNFAADLARLLDRLEVEAVHVVGAKLGGAISIQFAADYPDRTRTLSVVSGPVRGSGGHRGSDLRGVSSRIKEIGVRQWAAETQPARLGSRASAEQLAFWTDMMAATTPEVIQGVTAMAAELDLYDLLPRIKAPALVFSNEGSSLQSVAVVSHWQPLIPNSELVILGGDCYHPAAVMADECSARVLEFIRRHAASS